MGFVELQSEDLGIAFIELKLLLRFDSLSELSISFWGSPSSRIGALGSPNSCFDAIAEVVWVDVSEKAMEKEDGNFEKDEEKSE